MASVGDYVTAVLLAELTADDQIATSEVASRTNVALLDIFAARRKSRQILITQMCQLFSNRAESEDEHKNKRAKKEPSSSEDEQDQPNKGDADDDGDDGGDDDGNGFKPSASTSKQQKFSVFRLKCAPTIHGSTITGCSGQGLGSSTITYGGGDTIEKIPETEAEAQKLFLFCDPTKFSDFHSYFGMKLDTFTWIARHVGAKLAKQEKFRQKPYVKILVGLWMLTTQASFRSIGDKFGIQKSTAYYLFVQFVNVLASLADEFIKWPNSADMASIAAHFKRHYGIPGVVGLVNSSKIPVKVTSVDPTGDNNDPAKDRNDEPYLTVTFQAACDHRMRFTDIHIGEPQRPHSPANCPWKTFEESSLESKISKSQLDANHAYHLLGNSRYPLKTYLLTPYDDDDLMEASVESKKMKTNLNRAHECAFKIIQRALGVLNRKFVRLKFINMTQRYDLVPQIIRAACVLHNIILDAEMKQFENELGIGESEYLLTAGRGVLPGSYGGSMDIRDYKETRVHQCSQDDHHHHHHNRHVSDAKAIIKRDSIAQEMPDQK